ncbi:MAG: phosphoenolpyruvate--protein phosphotransferase [Chlamydiales bacterium]|jgi:phosphotransferase system enzyme I (PtsI)|nr:phosphoenolpyruvate--protein phosphotransferase [Chlamydiales bacterium]
MSKKQEDDRQETRIQGYSVSEGIAIGYPFFLENVDNPIPNFPITLNEVDQEIQRYHIALRCSSEDLKKLSKYLTYKGSKEAATIIDTQIQILGDPCLTTHVEEKIRHMLQNIEAVFHSVITDYEIRFSCIKDSLFQDRWVDIMDLAKRVLRHLCSQEQVSWLNVPVESIIFAKSLIPSHAAIADYPRVIAFVTEEGGASSHAALIARSKGIPYVTCINLNNLRLCLTQFVIVDGYSGEVILSPSNKTLAEYQNRRNNLQKWVKKIHVNTDSILQTKDGHPVEVFANVGHLHDVEQLTKFGSKGVGLFRTEYLFFQNNHFSFSEEHQYEFYLQIIRKAADMPVTIRVFDIGGDKIPQFLHSFSADRSAFKYRGIRFLLLHKDLFRMQLRAILRVAYHGNVRILLPLISDLIELEESRVLIEQVSQELSQEGALYKPNLPLGCMIEIPSAVFISGVLARHCDFLSIGTNDLIQYSLGIDRSDYVENDFHYSVHPSIIRMIKMVTFEAVQNKKDVSICGEIASHPLFIVLLIGLGLKIFSCSPRYIPTIRYVIKQIRFKDAAILAQAVLEMDSSSQIFETLQNYLDSIYIPEYLCTHLYSKR